MRLLRTFVLALLGSAASCLPTPGQAQSSDAAVDAVPVVAMPSPTDAVAPAVMQTMVVSGEQPGPGLWRVSRDDHDLWILGTLSPLPKRMSWRSDEVERLVAGSQEVLMPAYASVEADIGRFRALFLLPKLLRARKNPDGETLQQQVPAEQYTRWLMLKAQYMGRNRSVEKKRPLLAAQDLMNAAVKRSGLSWKSLAGPLVRKTAKKHRVPVTQPKFELKIADPKAMLNEVVDSTLDDAACFEHTLDRLEQDLAGMRERANAWASGDMELLATLPSTFQTSDCTDAVLSNAAFASRGFAELPQKVADLWLEAAEKSLQTNASTFAVLPMSSILDQHNYIAALRARGYEVELP